MRRIDSLLATLLLTVFAVCSTTVAQAVEDNGPVRRSRPDSDIVTDRILVVWNTATQSIKTAQVAAYAKLAGTMVASERQIAPQLEVLQLASKSPVTAAAMLANLRADPRVRFADYDHRRFAHATTPNDDDFPYQPGVRGQWYLQGVEAAAIRANVAWDTSRGNSGIVIADLDTGVRYNHPDLLRATAAGKLLPGYDFVTDVLMANDGNARDADPSDPGDWISAADVSTPEFSNCELGSSSWHGTRTAGIIGALTNNTVGIAGINWNAYVLPVRVLGKCGGFDSDILDAMRWAAGLTVTGAPTNPYPARVINMSLGGTGACNAFYVSVLNELTALGVVVVVSAGNDGVAAATPANCPGAVAVAGLRSIGTKVGFSNLGSRITISAPGGNCVNVTGGPCLFSIDTTTDTGTTVPVSSGYTDQSNFNVGTSFSAPMVSGVASLMMGVDANLKPSHIIKRLQSGATTPFPMNPDPTILACHEPMGDTQDSECNCTTATCGAGMLNAAGAIAEAVRPIASVALPASVSAGNPVSLDGNRSVAACGRTVATYVWSVTSGPGSLSSTSQANTSIPAPPAGMTVVVHLVVTDSASATDTADITITSNSATSSVPTITPLSSSCPAAITVPQVPAPTVAISVDQSLINSGQSATLTWSSTNASSCTASGAWSGAKATSGSQSTGALTSTGTFSLACDGLGGTSTTQSVTVTIAPVPTAILSVSPTSVTSGQSATLTWSSTDATGCTAFNAWTGAKATSGNESTGALMSTSMFTLVCDGPSGTSAAHSVTVTISAPSGGGGGGGAMGLYSLFALSLLLITTRRPASA